MFYLFLEGLCRENPHNYYTLKFLEEAWRKCTGATAACIYAYFADL